MASNVKILIAENDRDFARLAAESFMRLLGLYESPLVTLPTGLTPLGFYEELAARHAHRRDLWNRLRFIALDEYAGLAAGDERLFSAWLARLILDPLGIQDRILFDGAGDPAFEVARMQAALEREGPLDVAVLGLGANGHVAFNEPGTPFSAKTHAVALTEDSIRANARYWGGAERVPRRGMTLGLHDLAQARHTLLLVKGEGKADILRRTLRGPVTPDVPASYLQMAGNVTVVADIDAASALL